MGFDGVPEICFTGSIHKKEMCLPSALTCGPTLYLPLCLTDPDVLQKRWTWLLLGLRYLGLLRHKKEMRLPSASTCGPLSIYHYA